MLYNILYLFLAFVNIVFRVERYLFIKIFGFLVIILVLFAFSNRGYFDTVDTLSYFNIYFARPIRFQLEGLIFQLVTWPFSTMGWWKNWLFIIPFFQLLMFNKYIQRSYHNQVYLSYLLFFSQFFLISWLAGTLRIGLAVAFYLGSRATPASTSRKFFLLLSLLTHWSVLILLVADVAAMKERKMHNLFFIGLVFSAIITYVLNTYKDAIFAVNLDVDYNTTNQQILLWLYTGISVLCYNLYQVRAKALILLPGLFSISGMLFFDRILQLYSLILCISLVECAGYRLQKVLFVSIHLTLTLYFLVSKF